MRAGEVHALLGENGAGKSTLMGVSGGEIVADEGTIAFGDETLDRLTPTMARDRGLAIVHQHPALLPDLTVAENMALAVPAALREANGSGASWMRSSICCALERSSGCCRTSIPRAAPFSITMPSGARTAPGST